MQSFNVIAFGTRQTKVNKIEVEHIIVATYSNMKQIYMHQLQIQIA